MLDELPRTLHTFFLPQIEQLGMLEAHADIGGAAVLPDEMGEGSLWVAGLGDSCLLSVHDFTLHSEVTLHEYPSESYCITSMSASTAIAAPMLGLQGLRDLRERNTFTLYQDGSETEFALPANTRHWATTLCFTDDYFERAYALTGISPDSFKLAMLDAEPNRLPREVARCMDRLRPALVGKGTRRMSLLECSAIALEALSALVSDHLYDHEEEGASDSAKQIVSGALAYMEKNLDRQISLKDLARELYISRTTLCNAFNSVKGSGAAACITQMRIERAKELMQTTELSIKEISEAVGYSHQSSFCNAFKRLCGISPSAIRKR